MIKRADDAIIQGLGGGNLVGAPDVPAFFVVEQSASAIPVVIAAPHAGRCYPDTLVADLRHGRVSGLKLEDRYIDLVARRVAAKTRASLLVANAPRAMVDLNRAPDDLDPEMFTKDASPAGGWASASMRARGGLGLIPRRLPSFGELWRRRFTAVELRARLSQVHEPYHGALDRMLLGVKEHWGAALLIDLHSMPPLPRQDRSEPARIVIGDRFGSSCDSAIVAAAFQHFAQADLPCAHNRPYAGGYVLERHGAPAIGIHALQIEVDRACYLDAAMEEIGPGIDALVDEISALVGRLSSIVAQLGAGRPSPWPLAAE